MTELREWHEFLLTSWINERQRIRPSERPARAHRMRRLEIGLAFARVIARIDKLDALLHELEDRDSRRRAQLQGAELVHFINDLGRIGSRHRHHLLKRKT